MTKVLCIPKPKDLKKITEFDGTFSEYMFLERSIVDSDDNIEYASNYPQLIPYIVVKHKDKYLTYIRKGSEHRLHGSKSIGFGGHIDETDIKDFKSITDLIIPVIRELHEELGLLSNQYILDFKPVLIYSTKTNVDKVHIGTVVICNILSKNSIKPDGLEIVNPQWESMTDIRARMDNYETWSVITAKYLDK